MAEAPYGTGACCPPSAEGVTYLRVGPRKVLRGMMGLDRVFEQLYAMGRQPDETTDAELVGMARTFNYISDRPAVEADYATAIRESYRDFYECRAQEGEQETPETMSEVSNSESGHAPSPGFTKDPRGTIRHLLQRLVRG